MTTKKAIIATMLIILAVFVIGISVILLFIGTEGAAAERRASMLGTAMGLLMMLPIGAIWLLWADRFRKEREQKRQ